MNFKRGLIMALSMTAVLAIGNPALAAEVIKIAVPTPLTGSAAAYGDNVKAGVTMKIDEINAKGGVGGKKIEAVYFDEQCDPKEAATVATKIAGDDELVAIVGHLCSGAHLAALPNYVREGIAAMSPTATNVTIADKGKDESGKYWSFRNVYNDDFQGSFLADYMFKTLGLKKVAIFFANSDYGIGLKNAFTRQAKTLGLEVVGEEAYKEGSTDFTPQLTKLKGASPQALFIAGYYAEGALISDQAAKLGMNLPKFGADGLDNADYIKLAGPAADNTYLTTPFLAEAAATPEAKAFVDTFKAKYKRDVDWMSANAYDATGLIIEAIAKVGPDRAKIRDYLASINAKDKAYKGITGLIYFDAKGDCVKPAYVKMVKGGQFVPAEKQMN
jgi:branched-chain amino acid transport system substrate-binding protein